MKQVRFPIVSDDEIMLTEMPFMDLYDESDLISNIKGDYQSGLGFPYLQLFQP